MRINQNLRQKQILLFITIPGPRLLVMKVYITGYLKYVCDFMLKYQQEDQQNGK